MDEKTRADLQREYNILSERASSSRVEADQIRASLKRKQERLNAAETALINAQEQSRSIEAEIAALTARLEASRAQESQQQAALHSVHQEMATLAQSLGPIAQKQKRFEDALALVEQNLGVAKSANSPQTPQSSAVNVPAPPPQATSASNPQRSFRKKLELNLSFEIDLGKGSEHNFYTGLTNNISEGGVFISTPQVLDIGTKIKFPLTLPGMMEGETVEGEVRWVRREGRAEEDVPPGVGVQFTQISDNLKARINHYLEERESIFYED